MKSHKTELPALHYSPAVEAGILFSSVCPCVSLCKKNPAKITDHKLTELAMNMCYSKPQKWFISATYDLDL